MLACEACYGTHKPLICQTCVDKRVYAHKSLIERYESTVGATQAKALRHCLASGHALRVVRASAHDVKGQLLESKKRLTNSRNDLRNARNQLAMHKSATKQRRDKLRRAMLRLTNAPEDPFEVEATLERSTHIARLKDSNYKLDQEWRLVAREIIDTRRQLINSVLRVFPIEALELSSACTTDPPSVCNREEVCKIASAVLPPIKDFIRYPPEEISAAVSHTSLLLRLCCVYLGVQTPFTITVVPKLSIKAASSAGIAERYSSRMPLYISPSIIQSQRRSKKQHDAEMISKSHKKEAHLGPFVTALTMLSYNVAFLRSVLSHKGKTTGHVLENLRDLLVNSTFSSAHQTLLNPIRNNLEKEPMDFAAMLATNMNALAIAQSSHSASESQDDWSLVET